MALIAGCGGTEGASGTDGSLSLSTSEVEKDYGIVWAGAILAWEVPLRVDAASPGGGDSLTIRAVKTDCGCAVASLVRVAVDGARTPYVMGSRLEEGAALLLEMRYDTRGRKGNTPKQVRLIGNMQNGPLILTMKASVRPWLISFPATASTGRIDLGMGGSARMDVYSQTGEPYQLTHSGVGLPGGSSLELTPLNPGEDGRAARWTVDVTLGPDTPRGVRSWPVHLLTDRRVPASAPEDDGTPRLFQLSPGVSAEVIGWCWASPVVVSFGNVRPGETVARTMRVATRDEGFDLQAPRVRIEGRRKGDRPAFLDCLHVTTRPVEGSNAWDVEIVLTDLPAEGNRALLATILIETGYPRDPLLEASLTAFRVGKAPSGGR